MMQLDNDRVSVFFSRTCQAEEPACRAVLSPDELEKAAAFRCEKDRQLSILARAQIRYLMSEVTGVPAKTLSFTRDDRGKPQVRPGTAGAGISFSVSHTRGMVICALGLAMPLGVDLEVLDRKVEPEIARRFFSPAETRQIMAMPGPDQGALFLRFWTLKEAWAKADGRGIAAGLDGMVFDLSRSGRIGWNSPKRPRSDWQFFQFFPAPNTVAALGANVSRPLAVDVYECVPFMSVRPLALEMSSSHPPGSV